MNIKRIGSAITIVIVVTELIVVTKAISTIIFDLVKEEHTLMGVCYRLGVIAMILMVTAISLMFLTYKK